MIQTADVRILIHAAVAGHEQTLVRVSPNTVVKMTLLLHERTTAASLELNGVLTTCLVYMYSCCFRKRAKVGIRPSAHSEVVLCHVASIALQGYSTSQHGVGHVFYGILILPVK